MYKAVDITERTKRIRAKYQTLAVPSSDDPSASEKYRLFCSGDRWVTLGYLRGWDKHSDAETTRLRTSYAEAEELYQAEPIIFDDELLLGHLYLPEYSEEEQKEYDSLCESFRMSAHTLKPRPPRRDHLALDLEKLIRLGISGIKKELEEKMNSLELDGADIYPDFELLKKKEFYYCCMIELDAVSDLAKRYCEEAGRLSKTVCEPRKSELKRLAEILGKVPDEPASSFYEALQSVQFFLSPLFGLYPLGRPDQYLYEFYEQDIKNNVLTKEFAQELIDNFCLYVSERVFSRAACGFIVGGQDKDGNLIENDLTYMFITALDHLRLPDPNGALAVNDKTSSSILEYAAEVLSHGVSHPAFYNDNLIINSLIENYSVPREDAVNYIHSTCAEISVVGKSRSHTTPYCVDLPQILLKTAKANRNCLGIEEFADVFFGKVKNVLKIQNTRYAVRMMEAARIGSEPMRVCVLVDDCIKRGKSICEGGERYSFIQPIFAGFATVVDSFLVLEELVFKNKELTFEEFYKIVENNFEENEALRQQIIHKLPHYGNDDERADKMAEYLAKRIQGLFEANDLPMSKYMMPGTFSYITHASMGAVQGATFDGRVKGYSYSDGCSPVQGRDINGPTAMIKSLTSWEQSKFLGGMVVNIKFGSGNLKNEQKQNFIALLKTFINRGGIEMQVNVVDRETLKDARENPENYSDLIVRIGGYSDYFIRLSPEMKQEIIDRTEY